MGLFNKSPALPWEYFDDLRSHAASYQANNEIQADDENVANSTSQVASVRTEEGSHVVEVTTLDENQTYRLCTLPAIIPVTWRGFFIPHLMTQINGALAAVRDFNEGVESLVSTLPTSSAVGNSFDTKCDIRLVMDFYNTDASVLTASRHLIKDVLAKNHPYEPVAVVGTLRSPVSSTTAVLNSLYGIPQISHMSRSKSLDKQEMFGRVVPTTAGVSAAVTDFFLHITKRKITHFALIYFHDEYGTDLRQSVVEYANKHGIRVKAFAISLFESNAELYGTKSLVKDAVEEIAKSGLRYIFCPLSEKQSIDALREGARQKVAGPGYLWVFNENINPNVFIPSVRFNPNSEEDRALAMAFHGTAQLAVNFFPKNGRGYQYISEVWNKQNEDETFKSYFESKQPLKSFNYSDSEPTAIGALIYDVIMALGIAACSIEKRFFDGPSLFEAFKATKFDGATGRVEFDELTGTRDYKTLVYSVSNILLGPLDKDGNITLEHRLAFVEGDRDDDDDNHGSKSRWNEIGKGFNYSDFSLDVPDPLPPLEEDKDLIGRPLKIVILSLCAIVLFLSLFFAFWTYYHRQSRIVKSSQPIFLILICVGAFITSLSIIPLSFEEPPMSQESMDFSCMAIWWTYTFGFTLTMTALFSKTWRVNKVMGQKAFRRIKVRTVDVILPGVVILSANVAVLGAWTMIAPAKYERTHKFSNSYDRYGRPDHSVGICVSSSHNKGFANQTFFLCLLFVINGGVVLLANYQAWKARKITTEYAESRFIGFAMIVLLQILLIGLPMIVFSTTRSSSKANYTVMGLNLFVSSGVVLLLIFVPKLIQNRELIARRQRLSHEREERLLNCIVRKYGEEKKSGGKKYDNSVRSKKRDERVDSNSSDEDGQGVKAYHSKKEKLHNLEDLLRKNESLTEELRHEGCALKAELCKFLEEEKGSSELVVV